MKGKFGMTALGGLGVVLAAAISAQAMATPVPSNEQASPLILAEYGYDRHLEWRAEQRERFNGMEDESAQFTQMLEREPTAAGPETKREASESVQPDEKEYRSPVYRDRYRIYPGH